MSNPIYKYSIRMNGTIDLNCRASNETQAMNNAKQLFGSKEKFELIATEFSHNTGDYSITKKEQTASTFKSDKVVGIVKKLAVKKKGDLLTNVLDAYAKDSKVDL